MIDSDDNIIQEAGTDADDAGNIGISAFEGIDIQEITLPSPISTAWTSGSLERD